MIRSASLNGSDKQEIKVYDYQNYRYSMNGIAVYNDYLYYTSSWSGRYVNQVDRSGSNFARSAMVHDSINDVKVYNGRVKKDPCVTYKRLDNAEKRSTGFFADWTSEESISDEILVEGWYRIYSDNGDDMPTTQLPRTKYCGTMNPFWLNGSGPVHCPPTNFPTASVSVEVEALLTEGEIIPIPILEPKPSLIPIFKCEFDDQSNGTYAYDVYWLICGNVIKNNKNLLFKDIANAIVLKETDWHDKYKMNMEVKCAIRMRNSRGSTPGPYLYSSIFRAGFYPDTTYYTVTEGESFNITFTSTVPVGCISSHPDFRSHCDLNFYISRPNNGESTCINNVIKRDIVFRTQFCGIRVGNLDWMEKKTVQVYGYNDGMYNVNNRYAYIRVSTSSANIATPNNIWRDVQISQITGWGNRNL
ncbi:hypothetical protein AM593_09641, partial [Mytilus galloprovincialis]